MKRWTWVWIGIFSFVANMQFALAQDETTDGDTDQSSGYEWPDNQSVGDVVDTVDDQSSEISSDQGYDGGVVEEPAEEIPLNNLSEDSLDQE
ncbi:MAG: hypothetical protein KDK51_03670 [Deltaproteobacteria bacterium]|nr:hypothetical protein [Deltaproteobacteria bacterium]